MAVVVLPGRGHATILREEKPPASVCTVSDERLNEISGIVATADGYAVINDGGQQVKVYLLDEQCDVTDVITHDRQPRDPEDLARTSDGMLWVGDLGDNNANRPTAAIWKVTAGSSEAELYRLEYPDSPHDAEALLMPEDKTPIVITKDLSGTAKLYRATKPVTQARDEQTIPMEAAGEVKFTETGTPGGEPSGGVINQLVVTGAALSPDGTKVALRTYTDAYEWDIPKDTDVATAITGSTPRRTPLPDEPLGEAITYSTDGASFVTVSEGTGQPIHQWAPAGNPTKEGKPSAKSAESTPWYRNITLDQVMFVVYVLGILGLVLLGIGIFGIVRHRRSPKNGLDNDADLPDSPRSGALRGDGPRNGERLGLPEPIRPTGRPDNGRQLKPSDPSGRRMEAPRRGRQPGGAAPVPPRALPPSSPPRGDRPRPTGSVYGSARGSSTRGTVYGGGSTQP